MFERLKRALDDALAKLEGSAGAGEDVRRLLAAMREELVEAKARIPELESHLAALERERADEKRRAEDCVRRAAQAEAIDDRETVEVAERFARQHLGRVAVLERKVEAARSELAYQREEVARMTSQLKDALARKDALEIQARRARSIEDLRGAGLGAFEAFDEVAERVSRGSDVEAAERELDRELDPGREWRPRSEGSARPRSSELEGLDREARAEELLEELKRRMGKEGG